MRIIIEQNDTVIDDRVIEPPPPADQVHDAGPAPTEMLRRFGREVPDEAELTRRERTVEPDKGSDEPYLNPLRAGQARARALKEGPPEAMAAEEVQSTKGGKAPSEATVRRRSRTEKPPASRSTDASR
jgi:hypothetical protein